MKLIDLLSVIPDECKIGLARPEDQRHGAIGYKYDAIARFACRNRLIKEQAENMDVSRVYPAANVQGGAMHICLGWRHYRFMSISKS